MSRELKGGTRELKQNIQIHAVRMLFCFMKYPVESGPDRGRNFCAQKLTINKLKTL